MKKTHFFLVLALTLVAALTPNQRLLRAQEWEKTSAEPVMNQEQVRNGDFELIQTGWHNAGFVRKEAGKSGAGLEIDHSWYSSPQNYFTLQEIYPPDTISAGTFAIAYRFELDNQPGLTSFRALILTLKEGELKMLAEASVVTAENFPGEGAWHSHSHTLTEGERQAIQQARAVNQRIFVYVDLNAHGLKTFVDNVSLVLSGAVERPTLAGSIAYIGYSEAGKPQALKRIQPDGSGVQTLWNHKGDAFVGEPELQDPAWKPDGTDIAFVSNHENNASAFHRDVYLINADGGNLRRLTNPPALGNRANHGMGTVTGRIYNNSSLRNWEINPMGVYVAGAAAPVWIDPPDQGTSVEFTVPNVADLGPGVNQTVTVIWSHSQTSTTSCVKGHEFLPGAFADVQAGQTVDVGEPSFLGKCDKPRVAQPSWKRDGSDMALVGPGGAAWAVEPGQSGIGRALIPDVTIADIAWSPADDRILYHRSQFDPLGENDASGIWLTSAGGGAGTRLIPGSGAKDVVWMPGGTGFLYSGSSQQETRNLVHYDIQQSSITSLTDYFNEIAHNPSISPDGRYAVFERQAVVNAFNVINPLGPRDLWLIDLQNPVRQWPLTKDGRSGDPTWSRVEPQTPPPQPQPDPDLTQHLYLPTLRR